MQTFMLYNDLLFEVCLLFKCGRMWRVTRIERIVFRVFSSIDFLSDMLSISKSEM